MLLITDLFLTDVIRSPSLHAKAHVRIGHEEQQGKWQSQLQGRVWPMKKDYGNKLPGQKDRYQPMVDEPEKTGIEL